MGGGRQASKTHERSRQTVRQSEIPESTDPIQQQQQWQQQQFEYTSMVEKQQSLLRG